MILFSSVDVKPQCSYDNDCNDNELCHEGNCQGACRGDNGCGVNTACDERNHRPVCSCLDGFRGDPYDPNRGCQERKEKVLHFCMKHEGEILHTGLFDKIKRKSCE